MSIKCFKLISGEDIIGNITVLTEDEFQVEKPLQIALTEAGYATIPFMPFLAGPLKVRLCAMVVEPQDVSKKTEDSYISQTSGIQIVTPSGGSSSSRPSIILN